MARVSWPSLPTRTKAGGQFFLLRHVIMRGGLACGRQVSPHGGVILTEADFQLMYKKDKVLPEPHGPTGRR